MRLYSIPTGLFKLDGGAMFGVVPKTLWSKFHPADENNLCTWTMRCLLIEDGNRLILVDNGLGNKQDAKFFSHYQPHGEDTLDRSLARHGFHRDDITDVFLTHLHFDHCGGSIVREGDKLVPAFKKAVYWSNQRHWQWAVEPNDREKASFLKENILPIQESGQLQFIQMGTAGTGTAEAAGTSGGGQGNGDLYPFGGAVGAGVHGRGFTGRSTPGKETVEEMSAPLSLPLLESGILPDFSIRLVHGHTDAMMLPQLRYKGKAVVFMADLLPSLGHVPIPYVMAYDMFPLTTLQEKKSFFSEAAAGEYVLFFEHDPVNECCILQQTEKGIRGGQPFLLSDL